MATNLRSKIRSLLLNVFARTSMGQNGIRVLTSAAASTPGEVFQNLKAIEETTFTANYVNVHGQSTDSSINVTLQPGDVLPGAWHNVTVTNATGQLIAYF